MPDSPACPHRPTCPGCPRFGEEGPAQGPLRIAHEIAAASGLARPVVHQLPGQGHRHRARLAIRGRARSPKIGLFQAGSHRIADTPRCPVHHPAINEAARVLREAIREADIEPYADKPHRGRLRYVQFVVERSSGRVQTVLVGNGQDPDILGELPDLFARIHRERTGKPLQGLFFNAQPERSNAILGPRMIHLAGEAMLRERLGGVDVFFPPGAFGQNHLPLFDRAITRVQSLVPADARIAEFYCGVGAMGLGLLARARELRFNERSGDGLRGLEVGLASRPEAERLHARVFAGSAGERLDALDGAEVVLVDPPRRGLDPELLDALVAAPAKRLIYLACGQASLVRDLARLLEDRRVRLSGIELFDFFPFTEHVETLVWLDAAPRNERQEMPGERSASEDSENPRSARDRRRPDAE